jgi:hypothetical protein
MPPTSRLHAPHLREAPAVADLFVGFFRRDLLAFYPQSILELESSDDAPFPHDGPAFDLVERDGRPTGVTLFGLSYRLEPREGTEFSVRDSRMIRAIGSVLNLRYQNLFQIAHSKRMELFRGGSEDHYVAAYVDPDAYLPNAGHPSRIASTILTLRTAALSTYENRRVSTGALLLGADNDPCHRRRPVPSDALPYGVELTSLKSIHKLCDGKRTLFLVDRDGRLAEIVDIRRWAAEVPEADEPEVPCARSYAAHARATRTSGHVCVVLSPNQEIKLFAGGMEAFSFAHGRWRMLDPATKFASWQTAVGRPELARALFQAALNLAEGRQGGLFVVVDRALEAVGRLIAPHDLVATESIGPPQEITPGDPLAKRALHYLARDRAVTELDPPVLEALAGIDGAFVTDRSGRLLAFGAILRHDAAALPTYIPAEGARTTAALVASRFGPVLKVSEDGVVSCFLRGVRAWDL